MQIHLSAHAIKNAKAYCCSMCGRAYTSVSSEKKSKVTFSNLEQTASAMSMCLSLCFLFFQETYLIKHMSKHTMMEHVVSHHSPQHRTESPAIPIRISLI